MKYETYIAFDSKGTPRYAGIGKPGRHRHINSGESHSDVLNAVVAVHGPLDVTVDFIEHHDEKTLVVLAKAWETEIIEKLGRIQLGTGPLLNRSKGGEESSWAADKKWFTSPLGTSKRFSRLEDVPDGWVAGRNTKGKGLRHGKFPIRRGWSAWHNPSTGEILQLDNIESVPEGFIRGTGKNTILGKKWFHDPITNKRIRRVEGEEPPGFVKGRK